MYLAIPVLSEKYRNCNAKSSLESTCSQESILDKSRF
jgi:hypothetical protein